MSIVMVRNLVKEYPSFRLNNVTFSLEEGKITGFVGRNGAGKTTYRIMDSKGFYVGISGANMKNETNIILWTEASDASQTYIFEAVK